MEAVGFWLKNRKTTVISLNSQCPFSRKHFQGNKSKNNQTRNSEKKKKKHFHAYLWLHRSYFDTIGESCNVGLLWLDIVRQCRWEFDSFKWEVQGRHRPGRSSGQPAKQTTERRPRRLCRGGGGSGNFTQSWKPGQPSIACPALKSPNSKSEHINKTKSIV